ncbi:hypothetical protein B296_00038415 [Ensete ventricosum]|uniref:Uncharacterized protein n=1 Tax=Ensete ventricosum TaxID=4639 RepID=A0A426X3Y7_ENSVE|nr:hypothetical protein B296_00038415 [Ensete ventricosum]
MGVPTGGCCPYGLLPLRATPTSLAGWSWPQSVAPLHGGLGRGLAMGGRPYMGAGRGWLPLLAAFVAKIQQERVE